MSTAFSLDVAGIATKAGKSFNPISLDDMARALSFEGEQQTRTRIQSEKSAPDGTPWAKNAPWYAASKKGSLLQETGSLLDSLSAQPSGHQAEWGSNMIYAAVHQYGAEITPKTAKRLFIGGRFARRVTIPARPYLGLSDENFADMEALVLDVLDEYAAQVAP